MTPGPKPRRTNTGRQTRVVVSRPPQIGSAAADWSRWPAGTVFRLLSTGQIYRVEDYGWALSGRNTIDLYMASQREMNRWGAREETIEVLRWGDQKESLRPASPPRLPAHQSDGAGIRRPAEIRRDTAVAITD